MSLGYKVKTKTYGRLLTHPSVWKIHQAVDAALKSIFLLINHTNLWK